MAKRIVPNHYSPVHSYDTLSEMTSREPSPEASRVFDAEEEDLPSTVMSSTSYVYPSRVSDSLSISDEKEDNYLINYMAWGGMILFGACLIALAIDSVSEQDAEKYKSS